MRLCIIGSGAAGLMAANYFNFWNPLTEIIVVGSPEILPIGVGESNTLSLVNFHNQMGISNEDFITQSDASVKTGVYYKNWSEHDFIHNFKGEEPWKTLQISAVSYFQSFGNKGGDTTFHDYYGHDLMEIIKQNHIFLDGGKTYPISYHFDAAKYINFLKTNLHTNAKRKISYIEKTVVACTFAENEKIDKIILDDNLVVKADYYIFAVGSSSFTEKILGIKYESLSDVLLTNKAFVYPLEFTNKRQQFHPYTVAKTMKCGWRWITPTWSRIGTGYVFSDRHITPEKALEEFLNDIGDNTITPRLIDFSPRYSKKTFYDNFCLLGMANGFLEPLDAPGLTLTIQALRELSVIFNEKYYLNDLESSHFYVEKSNEEMIFQYKFWASFILTQYKTSQRNDTDFWVDHKNVEYDYYNYLMDGMKMPTQNETLLRNRDMLYHTISAKNVTWDVPYTRKPFKIPALSCDSMHHEDYINFFHSKRGLTTP